MARELGFRSGRHDDLENLTPETFDWKAFVLREELVRYDAILQLKQLRLQLTRLDYQRTLLYMPVLDSGFVIVYNMAPKVMLPELQNHLACPEACFQAATEQECFRYISAWISHPLWKQRRISVVGAIDILSSADLDSGTQQLFTQFGDLNLFVFTTGK